MKSVVSTVTGIWTWRMRNCSFISGSERYFHAPLNILTISRAHPASHLMGNGISLSHQEKQPGCMKLNIQPPNPHLVPRLRMSGVITLFPPKYLIKHRNNLYVSHCTEHSGLRKTRSGHPFVNDLTGEDSSHPVLYQKMLTKKAALVRTSVVRCEQLHINIWSHKPSCKQVICTWHCKVKESRWHTIQRYSIL
jgi:hypothetical protein